MDACLQFRIFSMAGLTPFAQIGTPYVISLSCFRPFDLSRFLLPGGTAPGAEPAGSGDVAGPAGGVGRPEPPDAPQILDMRRVNDHRRVRLRTAGADALAASRQPDVQSHRWAQSPAEHQLGDVLERSGFRPLRGRSPQLRGHCPLRHCPVVFPPRFSVNLQRHVSRCFACGSAGNQLDLWAAAHQLSLPAAAVHLCRVTETPVPRRQTASPPQQSTRPATG